MINKSKIHKHFNFTLQMVQNSTSVPSDEIMVLIFTLHLTSALKHKGLMSDFTLLYLTLFSPFNWKRQWGKKFGLPIILTPKVTYKSRSKITYLAKEW